MKFIVAPILILLILSQLCSTWLTLASFTLNRDYIARNLCENRTRPVLKCKGKCVLMKKLKQEDQEERASLPFTIDFSSVVVSSKSFYPNYEYNEEQKRIGIVACPVVTGKPIDRSFAIFHPPAA